MIGSTSSAVCVPQLDKSGQEPEVLAAVKRLEAALDVARDRLCALESRLEPVLAEQKESGIGACESNPRTALGARLGDSCRGVDRLCDRLERLLRDLEI